MTTTHTTLARSGTAPAPTRTTARSRRLDLARTWRGVTSGALWLLESGGGRGHHGIEVSVLTGANLFVTMMRFVVLRAWVFVRRPSVEPVATA